MPDSSNKFKLNGYPTDQEDMSIAFNLDRNLYYPEVYYKVQPFVMSVCDQMHSMDETVKSQEMFDQISDNIYTAVCSTYPDLAEYAGCSQMKSSVESLQRYFDDYDRDRDYDQDRRDRDYDRDRRGRFRFRRRGIFRDFIDLLFLNELIRRGRYYPYYPYYPYSY